AAVDQESAVHLETSSDWAQAIGSEVAAETNSSALTSAPAKMVAVSRAEAKDANIVKSLLSSREPDHRAHDGYTAGTMPIAKSRDFSITVGAEAAHAAAVPTVRWEYLPTHPCNLLSEIGQALERQPVSGQLEVVSPPSGC